MRTMNIFWILLSIRAIWDIYLIFNARVLYSGDLITMTQFITNMDGFLLVIGLFFGTVFPLIALYFAREVIKLKNIQATTGMLYVILCSVVIGDIAYKYYLIKFGLFL